MRKIVFLHLSLLLCMVYACSTPFESKKESEKQSVISEARAYFETNASDICSVTRSTLVRVSLKNGKNVYVYIPATIN